MTVQYVPYITTSAGACLTQANWNELNIQYAVCGLEHILVKPGLMFWQNGMDLKTYLAWNKTLFLDASSLDLHKGFTAKSPYDGALIKINLEEFWFLVAQLKPDAVLLPAEMAVSNMPTAVVTHEKKGLSFEFRGQQFWASDEPAQHAMHGMIYQAEGQYNLLAPEFTQDFNLLAEGCACPTCQQSLTRAYLQHLLQNTALLCQRFLLIHNVYWLNRNSGHQAST